MYTVGINAAFHDSSACLVRDGRLIAAAEEERFTHIKHGKRPVPFSTYELPFHAIDYCLQAEGIELEDVDQIGYSFDPFVLTGPLTGNESIMLPLEPSRSKPREGNVSPWEDLLVSYVVNAPRHLRGGFPHHLHHRFAPAATNSTTKWRFVNHHLAHAASAFLPSPFEEAAVMIIDGRGERATTSYWLGLGTELDNLGEVELPHSLGLLYEQVTEHLGFLHSSDEYKVMALASFGEPSFAEALGKLITVGKRGHYGIKRCDLESILGPAREPRTPLEGRHYDIAKSLQVVLEDTVIRLAQWLSRATGSDNLCLAGGVALNCVMNSRLRDSTLFRNVWIQPAAGDAGTALGAALYLDQIKRVTGERTRLDDVYLGPEYSEDDIERQLRAGKLEFRKPSNLIEEVVEALVNDRVVGWFQGRMEFGPRALGARSILASPLSADMQARLNELKDREDFRPVAPVVLAEEAENWFTPAGPSPFMLFVHNILPKQAQRIPAVRHVDGSARIQTIESQQHPLYHSLVKRFGERTGVPILVNTSFNTRGKPIVCSPRDAIEAYMTSPIDVLVIGPFVLEK